jgi:predicted DNA-binding protein
MATKSSDVMMSIRLPKELRDSFAKVCEDRNQTASKVIKSFMEDYVKKAKDGDGK